MGSFLQIIPESVYYALYATTVFVLCLLTSAKYANSKGCRVLNSAAAPPNGALLLMLGVALYVGFRPLQYDFGDTIMYRHVYNSIIEAYSPLNLHTEWLWDDIAYFFKSFDIGETVYFFAIAVLYVGLMFVCSVKLFPNNTWLAFLFFLAAYSFWGYGVNGLRNGLATSIFLVCMAMVVSNNVARTKFLAFVLIFLAFSIHRTILLPAVCLIVALYAVKEPKNAIRFWLFSILLSLVAGNSIAGMFSALGFDDRMSRYAVATDDAAAMSEFSHTGFRWDFLLYSAMPVLMTWYVAVKRGIKDRAYSIIAVTYILANSFWIMVIRSSFSNRFAYLSWFLYPLVIAYPLLKLHVWKDQDRKTARILLAYAGFTYFMLLIGK